MSLEILINNDSSESTNYITWSPSPCRIVSTDTVARNVTLTNLDPNSGGQVVFLDSQMADVHDQLGLAIPPNSMVEFYIAGKFDFITGVGYSSNEDGDAGIAIVDNNTGGVVGNQDLMVRVRKNANELTSSERDRFLNAIVTLNNNGGYLELQNMHISSNSREIHFRSCFLPWHRGFLLDLERRLQEIDSSVTIPYWNFDIPAPNIFNRTFMGVPMGLSGVVDFSAANPLINWRVDINGVGTNRRISRGYRGGVNPAHLKAGQVRSSEAQTINRGVVFSQFASPQGIEGDPHGGAHMSFIGEISNIGVAPADPLFFLLHCNIDRLWAKWQLINSNYDPIDIDAYPNLGSGDPTNNSETGIGNFSSDTMWPWNSISGFPRPNHAPGGGMPISPLGNFPGNQPTVGSMIDFQGQHQLGNNLYFTYDDVPFDLADSKIV